MQIHILCRFSIKVVVTKTIMVTFKYIHMPGRDVDRKNFSSLRQLVINNTPPKLKLEGVACAKY